MLRRPRTLLAAAVLVPLVHVGILARQFGKERVLAWHLDEIGLGLAVEWAVFALPLVCLTLMFAWLGRWRPPWQRSFQVAAGGALAAAVGASGLLLSGLPEPLSGHPGTAGAEGPLVVLLTLDTLRRDHVSSYPDAISADLMPELRTWSQGALRFDRAYAPGSLTLPVHTTFLSGQPIDSHGVLANGRALPPGLETVPARLAAQGWSTAAFVSSSVLSGNTGLRASFHTYRDTIGPLPALPRLPILSRIWGRLRTGPPFLKEDGARTVARAGRWIEELPARRAAFLWVHLYDPHLPHSPADTEEGAWSVDPCQWARHPAALRRGPPRPWTQDPRGGCGAGTQQAARNLAAGYAAEVRALDRHVGRLLETLEATKRDDISILVVADHGENLGEHQQLAAHAWSLTEPVVAVPLLIAGRGVEPGVVGAPVSTTAVGRTLLGLAGVDSPSTWFGPSLLQTARDGAPSAIRFVGRSPGFARDERGARRMGVRVGRRLGPLKVIVDSDGHVERYDLDLDPGEHHALVSPAEAEAAQKRLRDAALPPFALPAEFRPGPRAPPGPESPWFGAAVSPVDLARFDSLDEGLLALARRLRHEESVPLQSLAPGESEALRALGYTR